MSAQQPVVVDDATSGSTFSGSWRRLRWFIWIPALIVGITGGLLIAGLQGSRPASVANGPVAPAGPDARWAAGVRRAPDFRLIDQAGRAVSIAAFRGRPVIVTFIDPLCRNLCPLEAKVLDSMEAQLPARTRPAILAVSVDQWGDARRHLLEDVARWRLPAQWHWAVGAPPALRRVWGAYQVAVQDQPKVIAGVTVHNILHTEAAFLVDPRGYQRALYLWPFSASDVARAARQLAHAAG